MYQGKKVSPLHLRLLQGVKAKHLLRFEERKQKLEEGKTRKTEIIQLKKDARKSRKDNVHNMNTQGSDMNDITDTGNT